MRTVRTKSLRVTVAVWVISSPALFPVAEARDRMTEMRERIANAASTMATTTTAMNHLRRLRRGGGEGSGVKAGVRSGAKGASRAGATSVALKARIDLGP